MDIDSVGNQPFIKKWCYAPLFSAIVAFMCLYITQPTYANPQGGVVAAGTATISYAGKKTTIHQSTQNAIINWKTFNIKADEHTHFQQPSISSATLNRINATHGPSNIFGRLSATGKLFLVNPAGILFGRNSRVDAAGLFATTANITDRDFMAGRYHFVQDPRYPHSMVINHGNISVHDKGLVALVAPGVENHGVITAKLGKVALGAGTKYTLDLYGDNLINFAVDSKVKHKPHKNGKAVDHLIENTGAIYADGGSIHITAKSADRLVSSVINMKGVARANYAYKKGGTIVLGAGSGKARVSGKLYAKGGKGGKGTVKVLGKKVELAQAEIDVSNSGDAGEILIGGNYQGQGPEMNAIETLVDEDTKLLANAYDIGNGGRIIIWSDDYTYFDGHAEAKGGLLGGDGGLIETSGKIKRDLGEYTYIDARSYLGKPGLWLLDATNEIIDGPTGALISSVLDDGFGGGTDVTIQTSGAGVGAGDIIFVGVPTFITWGLTTSTNLSLLAHNDITFTNDISLNIANSGAGKTVLRADIDGDGAGTINMPAGIFKIANGGGGTVDIYHNPSISFPLPVANNYSGNVSGGTLTTYILVKDVSQLQNIGIPANLGKNFALSRDIDAGGVPFTPIVSFSGNFDGLNHAIYDLTINTPLLDNVGLFSSVIGASIKNVALINANITGKINVGALVGINFGGTIDNVFSTGSVTGDNSVGGLAGAITMSGMIHNAYSNSDVTGFINTGGLLGTAVSGNISNVYSTGDVINSGLNAGGLIGGAFNTVISNAYSTGDVTGVTGVGGFIGRLFSLGTLSNIDNAYSTGSVSGVASVGGFAGIVFSTPPAAIITNAYWDTITSGVPFIGVGTIGGGALVTTTGLTTAAAKMGSSYGGFSGLIWDIVEGKSYPYLKSLSGVVSGSAPSVGLSIAANAPHEVQPSLTPEGTNTYTALISKLALDMGIPALLYIDNPATKGNALYLGNSSMLPVNLNIQENRVQVRSDGGIPISNRNLKLALGSSTGTNFLYTNPSDLNLALKTGIDFSTTSSTSYYLDGNILGDKSNIQLDGPVKLVDNVIINTNLLNTDTGDNSIRFLGGLDVADKMLTLNGGAGSNLIEIELAALSLSGGSIVVNGMGGDDQLFIDFGNSTASASLIPTGGISYDGGLPTTGPGDILTLAAGTTETVEHDFTDASSGTIRLTDADTTTGLVTYTGLEPVFDFIFAANKIFNFSGAADVVTLGDDGSTNNISRIDSPTTERVDFINPTTLLRVNTLGGSDILNLNALDMNFGANIDIRSGNGGDIVNINAPINLGTSLVVRSGNGNDSININTLFASLGSSYTLRAGGGSDVINLASNNPSGLGVPIIIFGGNGGSNNDTITSLDSNPHTWDITGVGVGSVVGTGLMFSRIENINAGSGNDIFNMLAGGSLAGNLDGGAGIDTLNYMTRVTPVSVNLATSSATDLGSFSNLENFVGSMSPLDMLTGNNSFFNFWNITGTDAGTVTPFLSTPNTFSSFENLIASTGFDTFTIFNGGFVTGSIAGTAGFLPDTISYAPFTAMLPIVNLETDSATRIASFSGIETFVGSSTLNGRLIGENNPNTWLVTGTNSGAVDGTVFVNFHQLAGGTDNDTFNIIDGLFTNGSLTGGIGGNSGLDTLNYSLDFSGPITVNLQTQVATKVPFFTNIENFVGSPDMTDNLIGENNPNIWNILGADSGNIDGSPTYSSFENLFGGNAIDVFRFHPGGSVKGNVDGGGAFLDTLDYFFTGDKPEVNLADATATGIGGNFISIGRVRGDMTLNGTLIGQNNPNTWNINLPNRGNVDGFQFFNISDLTGGSANDIFRFNPLGSVSGNIHGMGGAFDGLDYINRGAKPDVNLVTITATGIGGTFMGIEGARGDAVLGGMLTGQNNPNLWTIQMINGGDVDGFLFRNMSELIGGSTSDHFKFNPLGIVTWSVDGAGGSDTLDYSMSGTPILVNLEIMTASRIGSTFSSIENLIGDDVNQGTLIGKNMNTIWNLLGLNRGNVTDGILMNFEQFDRLVGGSANDRFVFFDPAFITGVVDGGAGFNVLDFTNDTRFVLLQNLGAGSIVDQMGNALILGGLPPFLAQYFDNINFEASLGLLGNTFDPKIFDTFRWYNRDDIHNDEIDNNIEEFKNCILDNIIGNCPTPDSHGSIARREL